jgi:hypothetical protein
MHLSRASIEVIQGKGPYPKYFHRAERTQIAFPENLAKTKALAVYFPLFWNNSLANIITWQYHRYELE